MNERIKELAEQAGYFLYDLTETHERKTVETDSKDEWITLERFAELVRQDYLEDLSGQCMKTVVKAVEIEREACAKVCENASLYFVDDQGSASYAADYCASEIKARWQK